MSTNGKRPPTGLYMKYLQRYGESKRANGEQITDTDSEQYWREREKWHAEQQKFKKAA